MQESTALTWSPEYILNKEVLEENENALGLSSVSWGRTKKAAGVEKIRGRGNWANFSEVIFLRMREEEQV